MRKGWSMIFDRILFAIIFLWIGFDLGEKYGSLDALIKGPVPSDMPLYVFLVFFAVGVFALSCVGYWILRKIGVIKD